MQNITLPDPKAYFEQVWALVQQVPYGRVVTYGQIAQMLPAPAEIAIDDYKVFGPRWVGNAMAACPENVPWQRVINAQGKVSDRRGAMKQQRLLQEEGIEFVNDKVNLKLYQWHGDEQEDEQEDEPLQGRLF